jgi:endogenous inhibitor of DNA gyrase (YacG/DUF329 family)
LTEDVKEVLLMNTEQKTKIASLRREGFGYERIAQAVGLTKNTVKSWCRRNNLSGVAMSAAGKTPELIPLFCPTCGKKIDQTPGKRQKRFCSDKCRMTWWNSHQDQITRKAVYSYTCAHCGKPFTAYGNSHRKYCSHACYIADRFGGDPHE